MVDISYRCRLRGGCGVFDDDREPSGSDTRLTPARPRLGLGDGLLWKERWERLAVSGRGVSVLRDGGVWVERVNEWSETGG